MVHGWKPQHSQRVGNWLSGENGGEESNDNDDESNSDKTEVNRVGQKGLQYPYILLESGNEPKGRHKHKCIYNSLVHRSSVSIIVWKSRDLIFHTCGGKSSCRLIPMGWIS